MKQRQLTNDESADLVEANERLQIATSKGRRAVDALVKALAEKRKRQEKAGMNLQIYLSDEELAGLETANERLQKDQNMPEAGKRALVKLVDDLTRQRKRKLPLMVREHRGQRYARPEGE